MSIDHDFGQDEQGTPSEHSYQDERRSWMRFGREPGTDFAVIVSPDVLAGRVEIVDESLGGFGLLMDGSDELRLNERLKIIYAGSFYQARIRHITHRADGRCTVGVSCT